MAYHTISNKIKNRIILNGCVAIQKKMSKKRKVLGRNDLESTKVLCVNVPYLNEIYQNENGKYFKWKIV